MSVNVQASTIKNVYEVSLPVVSQERQIRGAAFEQALIEVSVRVSGTSLAPTQIDLKQATRMVRRYRYKAMTQPEIDAYMKKSNTLIAPKFLLWVQFDDGKIKQQLRDNGLPIWGYQRPNVLVWLAVKDGRSRYILKKSDHSQVKDALVKEAQKRGLPIIWPEYDSQDKKAVKFSDVWGQFWEPVKQASTRYPVDGVLLGRMNWVKGSWKVDWSLLQEEKTENWQLTALDLGLLMNSGIGVATDHISSRFAVFANSANDGELMVRISGLGSVKKYAQASHYLSSLAPVKHVYATEVKQHQVDFHVELSGDENDLKRIIALGKVLSPDNRPEIIKPVPVINGTVPTVTGTPGDAQISVPSQGVQNIPVVPVVEPQNNILRYRLNG